MSTRNDGHVTIVDVRLAFDDFRVAAEDMGMKTDGWGVGRGTSRYHMYVKWPSKKDVESFDIGGTAREAETSIRARMDGMLFARDRLQMRSVESSYRLSVRALYEMMLHEAGCVICFQHAVVRGTDWCYRYKDLRAQALVGLRMAGVLKAQD